MQSTCGGQCSHQEAGSLDILLRFSTSVWLGGTVSRVLDSQSWGHAFYQITLGQCYFSCDFLVIVIVKVSIFQVFH